MANLRDSTLLFIMQEITQRLDAVQELVADSANRIFQLSKFLYTLSTSADFREEKKKMDFFEEAAKKIRVTLNSFDQGLCFM